MIHRHWTSKSLLVLWYLFEGIHHLKGSRLLILATNSGQIPNYGPDALDVDGRYRYFENTSERPMVNIHDNAGLCMKDSFWLSLSFSTSSSPFHCQSSITVLPIWASYFLQAKPIPTFRLDSGFWTFFWLSSDICVFLCSSYKGGDVGFLFFLLPVLCFLFYNFYVTFIRILNLRQYRVNHTTSSDTPCPWWTEHV